MAATPGDTESIAELGAGFAALIDQVNAGDSGLPAIARVVELTRSALGAAGASFTEYGPDGGRVIAAVGAMDWAVGRLVVPVGAIKERLLGQKAPVDCPVAVLPEDFAGYLSGRGVARMLAVRCQFAGQVVGSLHAFFAGPGAASSRAEHATIALLGAFAGHLYADGRTLPVSAEGAAFGALTDAVVVVGPDGLVRSFNSAAARLTGQPASEAIGRPLPVPVPLPGRVGEHRLGDGRWLQVLASEVAGGDSRLVTMRDVTEARRREEARDLFVAVTGHELRTPVTVIRGYADTLVNHWDLLDDADRLGAAQRLDQRARELARLVDRLLSAVGAGSALRGDVMSLPFDLADTLRLAVADLPEDIRSAVRLELPESLPKALGDRATLSMVLSELVTNATKYSEGPAEVTISPLVDASLVGFAVADRGIGVRAEHVERAFERFWQAESGDRRRYGGVGLGLYLVRRILERQNGWVSLRPRNSGGTVAEVRLQRADLGPGEA